MARQQTVPPNFSKSLIMGAAVLATTIPLFFGCVKKEIVHTQPGAKPKMEIMAKKLPSEDLMKTWDGQGSVDPGKQLKAWEQQGENLTFTKTVKQGDFVMLPLKMLPNTIGLGVMRVDDIGITYIICSSFLGENPCLPRDGPLIGKVSFKESKTAFRFTTASDDGNNLIIVQLNLSAGKKADGAADLTFILSLHLQNLATNTNDGGDGQ